MPSISSGEGGVEIGPTIAVIVCAYADERFDLLVAAVGGLATQRQPAEEVVVVIDNNERLLTRATAAFPAATVLSNAGRRGLSDARNTGVRHARSEIVAFLDDDARPHEGWLGGVRRAYGSERVIGTGGPVLARWTSNRPAWFPVEFDWVVGCTYRGAPTGEVEIRNPIGANMSFRRSAWEEVGGFSAALGRVGRVPLGCEETEFAIRARTATGGVVLNTPEARVDHAVSAERATWAYFWRRCWAEGISKAVVTGLVGAGDALDSERDYVRRALPTGVGEGLAAAVRGDRQGAARAGAIAAGLAMTTAGYVVGRLRQRLSRISP